VRVDDGGDGVVVDVSVSGFDKVDSSDTWGNLIKLSSKGEEKRTLFLSFVSQHRAEGDIADTFDVLLRGSVLVVNDNASPVVHFNPSSLNVEAFGVGPSANSDKDDIGLELEGRNHEWRIGVPSSSKKLTVSAAPPFAGSAWRTTLPSTFSAEMTLVLSLNLRPCFPSVLWKDLLYGP
jgi:hypothetical protein